MPEANHVFGVLAAGCVAGAGLSGAEGQESRLSHAVDNFDCGDVGIALGHAVRGFSREGGRGKACDVIGGERLIACAGHWNFAPFGGFENSGLGRPEKNIRFINGEGGAERGAVNPRSEAEPWSGLERKGRGSEHGAGLG